MLFIDKPADRFRINTTVEGLVAAAGLFWAFTANRLFLSAALQDRLLSAPSTWGFALALLVGREIRLRGAALTGQDEPGPPG